MKPQIIEPPATAIRDALLALSREAAAAEAQERQARERRQAAALLWRVQWAVQVRSVRS